MIPLIYELKLDFQRDMVEIINRKLVSMKFNQILDEENWQVYFKFYNLLNRLISVKKRKVHYANEFSCPPEYKDVISLIESKIEAGKSLWSYLSKNITDYNFNDQMINDWGVYHLHLGKGIDKKNPMFVERTRKLLFLKIDEENAYFINVMEHGDWSKTEILNVIHNNWQQSVYEYHLKEVSSVEPKTNENTVSLARKKKQFIVHQVNDFVYFPFGGGITSSGHSIKAVECADNLEDYIIDIEETISQNFNLILDELDKNKIKDIYEFQFKLTMNNENEFFIIELNTLSSIRLGNIL